MIQITEKELIELLHKATGNVKDFVMNNKKWLTENLPKEAVNKNDLCHVIRGNGVYILRRDFYS